MTNDPGTLDDAYLTWLYGQIAVVRNPNPRRSFWNIARQLYSTPFQTYVRHDENRAEDGKDLRTEFLHISGLDVAPYDSWRQLECSMLEMLIALSRHTAFEADDMPLEWFWRLMNNVGLDRYSDDVYNTHVQSDVADALHRVNTRSYSETGNGGLFPLRRPRLDQRGVELWYQKEAYLMEQLYTDLFANG